MLRNDCGYLGHDARDSIHHRKPLHKPKVYSNHATLFRILFLSLSLSLTPTRLLASIRLRSSNTPCIPSVRKERQQEQKSSRPALPISNIIQCTQSSQRLYIKCASLHNCSEPLAGQKLKQKKETKKEIM